jgi:hypothetical protein
MKHRNNPTLKGHHEMNGIQLPPYVEFHEDIHLFVYRPIGLMSEESVNKIVSVIEDLEAKVQEPFNRFFDTLGHDEVELNFRNVIQISLHRRLVMLVGRQSSQRFLRRIRPSFITASSMLC